MSHEHHAAHCGLHLGFEIAKLGLKAAAVCAAFLTVKEIHRVHKALESRQLLSKK